MYMASSDMNANDREDTFTDGGDLILLYQLKQSEIVLEIVQPKYSPGDIFTGGTLYCDKSHTFTMHFGEETS